MNCKAIANDDGVRTHIVVLGPGEQAFAAVNFANEGGIGRASIISAIGAFESAVQGSRCGRRRRDRD